MMGAARLWDSHDGASNSCICDNARHRYVTRALFDAVVGVCLLVQRLFGVGGLSFQRVPSSRAASVGTVVRGFGTAQHLCVRARCLFILVLHAPWCQLTLMCFNVLVTHVAGRSVPCWPRESATAAESPAQRVQGSAPADAGCPSAVQTASIVRGPRGEDAATADLIAQRGDQRVFLSFVSYVPYVP